MKLLLAAGVCGAVVLTMSSLSGLQEVSMNISNANQSVAAESFTPKTMYTLSVEAYQGAWGECLHYFCSIKDNDVPGWRYQKTITGTEDFSCTIWQNNYEDNTYAIVLSGTDNFIFEDFKTYLPMMFDEKPCSQLEQTVKAAKDMKNLVKNDIKKLYISGYSLGGYLSNYLAMELVDNANGFDSDIYVKDIGEELTIENVHCFSYAAPGIFAKAIEKLSEFPASVQKKYPDLIKKMMRIPDWVQGQLDRDASGLYDKTIKNYKNNKDLVANLTCVVDAVKVPLEFNLVGNVLTTDPPASFLEKDHLLRKIIQAKLPVNPAHLAYHAPDVYYGSIAKIEAQQQKAV